jgi:uncharacterized glyoxalase superfamily protein PhnB
VYPSLTYRDVGAALTWLAEAFGFETQVLDEASAIVRSGSGAVLIQTDRPEDLHGSHTGHGWVYVVVEDIDAHYARAKSAGASLLGEPHDYATATADTVPATSKETSGASAPAQFHSTGAGRPPGTQRTRSTRSV